MLDYATPSVSKSSAGKLAPYLALAAFAMLLGTGLEITVFPNSHPAFGEIAFYSMVLSPLVCLCGIASGARGLLHGSRYRVRSIVGISLCGVTMLAAVMLFGWLAQGFR